MKVLRALLAVVVLAAMVGIACEKAEEGDVTVTPPGGETVVTTPAPAPTPAVGVVTTETSVTTITVEQPPAVPPTTAPATTTGTVMISPGENPGFLPSNATAPVVVIDTNLGVIEVQLDPERAPISTKNFLEYVKAGFYNGTIFHRVIPEFMIQGGGYTDALEAKEVRKPIKNESDNGVKNLRGTIAMARTPDPDSATSQFFISVADNAALDFKPGEPGYAVFGKVVSGMNVADKIVKVPTLEATTKKGRMPNVPSDPVIIEKVTLKGAAAETAPAVAAEEGTTSVVKAAVKKAAKKAAAPKPPRRQP